MNTDKNDGSGLAVVEKPLTENEKRGYGRRLLAWLKEVKEKNNGHAVVITSWAYEGVPNGAMLIKAFSNGNGPELVVVEVHGKCHCEVGELWPAIKGKLPKWLESKLKNAGVELAPDGREIYDWAKDNSAGIPIITNWLCAGVPSGAIKVVRDEPEGLIPIVRVVETIGKTSYEAGQSWQAVTEEVPGYIESKLLNAGLIYTPQGLAKKFEGVAMKSGNGYIIVRRIKNAIHVVATIGSPRHKKGSTWATTAKSIPGEIRGRVIAAGMM